MISNNWLITNEPNIFFCETEFLHHWAHCIEIFKLSRTNQKLLSLAQLTESWDQCVGLAPFDGKQLTSATIDGYAVATMYHGYTVVTQLLNK